MKKISTFFVSSMIGLAFCNNLSGQVTLKVSKSISTEDFSKIEEILKSFDPNSFKLSVNTVDPGKKTKIRSLGLASVEQTYTRNNIKPAGASTNVNNNLFGSGAKGTGPKVKGFKASTVNSINIFKAFTVTVINIYKPSDNQLSKMDELHAILIKYK